MALSFKIGDKVDELLFVMKNGEILGATIGETDGIVYYKVRYTDELDNIQENYFAEHLLMVVE